MENFDSFLTSLPAGGYVAPKVDALEQHRGAMDRGANCLKCPLYGCGAGPVMPQVRRGAAITVVTESPSLGDVERGVPLLGSAGELTFEALAGAGILRENCTVTQVALCRPPGGHLSDYAHGLIRAAKAKAKEAKARARDEARVVPGAVDEGDAEDEGGEGDELEDEPEDEPVDDVVYTPQTCCAPRLALDVAESSETGPAGEPGARVILALGSESLRAMAALLELPYATAKSAPGEPRVATIKRQHGSPVIARDGRVLLASLHPAFALAGNANFRGVITEDITRAARIALRGGRIEWATPQGILNPTADQCFGLLDAYAKSGALLTVDIETDGIRTHKCDVRCVGLGAVLGGRETVVVIPWRHMDGRPWWTPGVEHRMREALARTLATCVLSGHNLAFDTAVLLARGLFHDRKKHWNDTLTAAHNTSRSELPLDLGFVASRWFEAPRWKDDADAKSVDGVDDYWLHKYCAQDVTSEMRLAPLLLRQMQEENTLKSFATDTALSPIARDMGALGLNIHEPTRKHFFEVLEGMSLVRTAELRRLTSNPTYNPNAFAQVARFLYVTKGLSPPFATDGREWGELAHDEVPIDLTDEDSIVANATTNESALLKLLDLGVDKHTAQFIEAQLSYRGIQKCKSTYLGLKRDEDGVLHDTFRERDYLQTEKHDGQLLSILHPAWRVTASVSGRWSSNPNTLNWPERVVFDVEKYKATDGKDGIFNMRAQVVAPPGHVLVGADMQAVELRLYAMQARDEFLLDAIAHGKDPHSLNYATMQARTPSEVEVWYRRVLDSKPKTKKYLRNISKRFVFLILYGGAKDELFRTMSADRNPDGTKSFPDLKLGDVEFWLENWHKSHPETKRWQDAVVRGWTAHGFVASLMDKRKRYVIGGMDRNAIINHVIQSSSADITNRAMLALAEACPYQGWSSLSGPILQVHDFIALQVPLARQKEAEALFNERMPYRHGEFFFGIEQKSGPSWDLL